MGKKILSLEKIMKKMDEYTSNKKNYKQKEKEIISDLKKICNCDDKEGAKRCENVTDKEYLDRLDKFFHKMYENRKKRFFRKRKLDFCKIYDQYGSAEAILSEKPKTPMKSILCVKNIEIMNKVKGKLTLDLDRETYEEKKEKEEKIKKRNEENKKAIENNDDPDFVIEKN